MALALLDTNAISDLMQGNMKVEARVASHSGTVLTSVIVLGEIEYGLNRLPAGKRRMGLEKRAAAIMSALRIEPVDEIVGKKYGKLKASLQSQGLNLDDNDLWIAATTMLLGATLVSRDQLLQRIPGLVVEDWSR